MLFTSLIHVLKNFFFSCFGVQPDKVKFQLRLGQSKPIYNAFKSLQESSEWQSLSEARKRIVECKFLTYVRVCVCM